MSDTSKTTETLPEPTKPSLTETAEMTAEVSPEKATTMHSDTLWGGPRFIHNASMEPVWCETKEDYWRLMRQTGFRMLDQQESTTGELTDDEFIKQIQAKAEQEILKPREVPPLRKEEAHIHGAIIAVKKKYGITEALWCNACFARKTAHGVRMVVNDKLVSILCRCGYVEYRPPTGTTDLVLHTLPNLAHVQTDRTVGTIETKTGEEFRPTSVLHDMEALIVRRYFAAMQSRDIEPKWFHVGCWSGDHRLEDEELAISITPNEFVAVCKCRTLFHRIHRVTH